MDSSKANQCEEGVSGSKLAHDIASSTPWVYDDPQLAGENRALLDPESPHYVSAHDSNPRSQPSGSGPNVPIPGKTRFWSWPPKFVKPEGEDTRYEHPPPGAESPSNAPVPSKTRFWSRLRLPKSAKSKGEYTSGHPPAGAESPSGSQLGVQSSLKSVLPPPMSAKPKGEYTGGHPSPGVELPSGSRLNIPIFGEGSVKPFLLPPKSAKQLGFPVEKPGPWLFSSMRELAPKCTGGDTPFPSQPGAEGVESLAMPEGKGQDTGSTDQSDTTNEGVQSDHSDPK